MDKQTALEAALVQIEKQFGKGSVMKLGDVCGNADFRYTYRQHTDRRGFGRRRNTARKNNRDFRAGVIG